MRCFVRSTAAVVSALAVVQPSFADPRAGDATRSQIVSQAQAQPACPAPVRSLSDVIAPASNKVDQNVSPVGFGWG